MPDEHQRQHDLERKLVEAQERLNAAEREVIKTSVAGSVALGDERWAAHKEAHATLAEALKEYKAAANEWRGLVSDFKSDYLSLPEWKAEHRSLISRVETLETARLSTATESKTTRELFANVRNLLLLIVALIGVALALITFFRG